MNGFSTVVIKEKKELGEGKWEVVFSVPADSSYYREHFEAMKLLPAVGETDVIKNIVSDLLGKEITISGIKRMKFVKPIFPGADILLSVDLSKSDKIKFNMSVYSTREAVSNGLLEI